MFNEYFQYDLTSETGLRWKKQSGTRKIGDQAGRLTWRTKGSPNSARVQFMGQMYQVHRIIYQIMIGEILDDMVVDHIDGNPFNNCIFNLKVKTLANNSRNLKLDIRNVSGYAGISLRHSNYGKNLNYLASFVDFDGKRKHKNFSILKYGEEIALKLAREWRDNNISRLKTLGFEYTERNKINDCITNN